MFLTKKHISRRTFIRSSVGATFALPLLDAMVPAQTPLARTAAAPLQRFGFIYVPHGSIMKDWTPVQEGAGFEFSPIASSRLVFRSRRARRSWGVAASPPNMRSNTTRGLISIG